MDKKTKILIALFLGLVLVAISFSYKKYFLEKHYLITAEVACDPSQEVCFIGHCDSEVEECEEEVFYYKKIEGIASALPSCDPNYEDCPLLWCGEKGNYACVDISCDSESEECTSPEDFSAELTEEMEAEENVENLDTEE